MTKDRSDGGLSIQKEATQKMPERQEARNEGRKKKRLRAVKDNSMEVTLYHGQFSAIWMS